jgi:hypothetical protein
LGLRIPATNLDHDPEKWDPVFGKDHGPENKAHDANSRRIIGMVVRQPISIRG